jgi:hypothetical protein
LLAGCSKTAGGDVDDVHVVDENDDIFPVISVTKPVVNQVYSSGDSIIIEGNVSDNKTLYKGKVQLKNDATSAIVAENFYETHFLKTISFRVAGKAVVTSATDFSIITEFEDHGLNKTSQTFKVKVNP